MLWVLESGVFASGFDLGPAVRARGHRLRRWDDAWWEEGGWPARVGEPVLFHGSLATADRVRRELPGAPGAYCATEALCCSAWYPRAAEWLLQEGWRLTTVRAFLAEGPGTSPVFVRPDSPLKPFSGRVLPAGPRTAADLDHGFYYDDLDLPIVVAPIAAVEQEWRFVVVGGAVITGSAYVAAGRQAHPAPATGAPWDFAAAVAREVGLPEPVGVIDVARVNGRLRLCELTPFSGADLYGCDPFAIVDAISALLA
jgi:hypothetical protein